MAADADDDLPAARRARVRAARRARKADKGRMRTSGEGVRLIQRLIAERAQRAQRALSERASPQR